jgi:alpha-tubulin suppressor-like RCC1 family protein
LINLKKMSDEEEEPFQSIFEKWEKTEKTRFGGTDLSLYTRRYLNYQQKYVNKIMVFGSPFSRHAFLVSKNDNKLYAFGDNKDGQLGISRNYKKTNELMEVLTIERKPIKKVCCGDNFSIIHLVNRTVLVCGSNGVGQIGSGNKYIKDGVGVPVEITVGENVEIEDVFVGWRHAVFITKNMKVYTCGLNSYGQLGVGHKRNLFTATKVSIKEDIFSAACGSNFTFFISTKGIVYGTGFTYALGFEKKHKDRMLLVPTKIKSLSKMDLVQLTCGSYHTVVLTYENKVYSFGQYTRGALGIYPDITGYEIEMEDYGPPTTYVYKPKFVNELEKEKILSIQCGGSHTLFETQNKVFGTGSNRSGQLPTKKYTYFSHDSINLPEMVGPLPFKYINTDVQILALEDTTLFFTKKELYGCGSGEYGELLTLKKSKEIKKLTNVEVKKVPKEEKKEKKERFDFLKSEKEGTTLGLF